MKLVPVTLVGTPLVGRLSQLGKHPNFDLSDIATKELSICARNSISQWRDFIFEAQDFTQQQYLPEDNLISLRQMRKTVYTNFASTIAKYWDEIRRALYYKLRKSVIAAPVNWDIEDLPLIEFVQSHSLEPLTNTGIGTEYDDQIDEVDVLEEEELVEEKAVDQEPTQSVQFSAVELEEEFVHIVEEVVKPPSPAAVAATTAATEPTETEPEEEQLVQTDGTEAAATSRPPTVKDEPTETQIGAEAPIADVAQPPQKTPITPPEKYKPPLKSLKQRKLETPTSMTSAQVFIRVSTRIWYFYITRSVNLTPNLFLYNAGRGRPVSTNFCRSDRRTVMEDLASCGAY